ncbi:receptor expression-enhancing protein 3-like [Asterias rubens]|uniref:receptor expression-enhancing protein 3-like n=1 Tax=Asterias rubens TaxID=7604 RepID=UPI001455022C|nr:receptor expression-enhancing protein 3-like [Asterias rubens]XP_033632867.1 receptor expression-enhancing protein 3-like [Asterias rubens]
MVSYIISRVVVLIFGTLYPAYASYKAVKTRNVKEYVKWMMYWIVFALFTFVETVVDIFASILPFYYEAKILFIFWLISPWTKGSTYLYRKFVHPTLSKREQEIDEYISQASNKGYEALKKVSRDGLSIAANVVMTSAIKGQSTLMDQLKNYNKNAPKNAIQEEEDSNVPMVENDGGEVCNDGPEEERKDRDYDVPLRERLESDPDVSPGLMDSLQSLDNRLREEHDNIKEYAAQISQQDEGGYVEEERPRQQRGKKKPDPSPRRAMPRYYERTQSREEFDNDENDMYMDGEDNYTFRRSPSLRSLRQQPTYMSGTEGSMSRSHYASADNLSRRPMRRKPETTHTTQPSTERTQQRYPTRTSAIKMTSKKKKNRSSTTSPEKGNTGTI